MSDPHQEIDTYIGARLRELRKKRGYSQKQIGLSIGVTYQQIQKYESGANRIVASHLQTLAGFFEVRAEYFFPEQETASPERRMAPMRKGFARDDEYRLLYRAFDQITDKSVRASIVRMVSAISGSSAQSSL